MLAYAEGVTQPSWGARLRRDPRLCCATALWFRIMQTIYLDHNSTTPIAPAVAEAMAECHRTGYVNPASQHGPGRAARRRLEEAREGIAELLGAKQPAWTPTR